MTARSGPSLDAIEGRAPLPSRSGDTRSRDSDHRASRVKNGCPERTFDQGLLICLLALPNEAKGMRWGEVGVGVVEGVQGAVMRDKHCSLLVVGEVVDRDPDPT